MGYEIPLQLQYQEKIMFGLTFKQLIYLLIFSLISMVIIKSIANFYLMVFLLAFPISIGVGFIFFKLDKFLNNLIKFLRFRKVTRGSSKFNKFFDVKQIKDNVIINEKGKKIAILKVNPINFSIKPEKEQEAIVCGFGKFLNSLNFPIQFLIVTEELEIKEYLKNLITSEDKKKLLQTYKDFIQQIIKKNKVLNKNFYIIIPQEYDLEIQVQLCEEKIRHLNLKCERLKDEQLKKVVRKFFNNNKSNLQTIINNKDFIATDDVLNRLVMVSGYPRSVEIGFLDKLVNCNGEFNISIHIKPSPIDKTMIALNKELQKQRADLYSMEQKGMINPSLEIQYGDTRRILEELQKGKDKLFDVSLYINCKAKNKKELDILTKKIESELNSILITPKIPNFRMAQGFRSCAPLCVDELEETRNVPTTSLSAFYPFTNPFFQFDQEGVWLGLDKNNVPIIRDIFSLNNPNGLILATSGSGKSYMAKLLISRYLLNNVKVMVIDPQGEYKQITKKFNGQIIKLSRDSNTMINILDLMGHDYTEKRLALMDLMKIMLGELTEPQKSFIDKAITGAYEKKGITQDKKTWNLIPPVLQDVQEELEHMEKRAMKMEQMIIRSLIYRLDRYTTGVFSFLNRHTSIDFNNKFVTFDIGELPRQVKPVLMFLILDYVYMKMRSDLQRKILLIDESWSLLSRTEEASYIFEIVKTCRKYNLGLLMINQEVEGLLNSQAGKSVLANTSYTVLMRQKPAVIDQITKTFNLSDTERNHILTAVQGEGILIMEDEHTEIKIIASEEEHQIITTQPDEILNQNTIPKTPIKQKEIKINVDEHKGFYKQKDLNEDEIKYLQDRQYKKVLMKSINTNKEEFYLIKPRFNESINHMFVIYDICEFLESKRIQTQKFTTKKPDITFQINNKKYAIEVETGNVYDHHKKTLTERIKFLENNYDNWFFVATNRRYVTKYRKLGKTIDPRFIKSFLEKIVKSGHQKTGCATTDFRRENDIKMLKVAHPLMHSCINVPKRERKRE